MYIIKFKVNDHPRAGNYLGRDSSRKNISPIYCGGRKRRRLFIKQVIQNGRNLSRLATAMLKNTPRPFDGNLTLITLFYEICAPTGGMLYVMKDKSLF